MNVICVPTQTIYKAYAKVEFKPKQVGAEHEISYLIKTGNGGGANLDELNSHYDYSIIYQDPTLNIQSSDISNLYTWRDEPQFKEHAPATNEEALFFLNKTTNYQ
jgi:hypothetical protein